MDQPGWGTEMRRKENGEDSDLDLDLDGESDGDVERPSMSQVPILSSMKSHVRHSPRSRHSRSHPPATFRFGPRLARVPPLAPRAPSSLARPLQPAAPAPAVSPTSEAIGKVFADHIGSRVASLSSVFPDIVCSATSYGPSRHPRHV